MVTEAPKSSSEKGLLGKILDVFSGTGSALDLLKGEIEGSFLTKAWDWLKNMMGSNTEIAGSPEINNLDLPIHKEVATHISEASNYYGLDTKAVLPIMLAFCQFESGFNPNIVNKRSGATGLYQFIDNADRAYRKDLPADHFSEEERNQADNPDGEIDPKVNTWMAVKLLMDNAKRIGVDLTNLNSKEAAAEACQKLYIAHNSGSGNFKAVWLAQKTGDYSLIDQQIKKHPKMAKWLPKRPDSTKKVMPAFNKFYDKLYTKS